MPTGANPQEDVFPSAGAKPLTDERFETLGTNTGFPAGQNDGMQTLETVSVALKFDDLGKYFIRLSAYGLDHLDEIYEALPDKYTSTWALYDDKEYLQELFISLGAAGGWLITNGVDGNADIEQEFEESPPIIKGVYREQFIPTSVDWEKLGLFVRGLSTRFGGENYEYLEPFEGDPILFSSITTFASKTVAMGDGDLPLLPDEVAVSALVPLLKEPNQAAILRAHEEAHSHSDFASSLTTLRSKLLLTECEQPNTSTSSMEQAEIVVKSLSDEDFGRYLIRLSAYCLDHFDEIYQSLPDGYTEGWVAPFKNHGMFQQFLADLGHAGAWFLTNSQEDFRMGFGEIPNFIEGVDQDGEFIPTGMKWKELGELFNHLSWDRGGSDYQYHDEFYGDPSCMMLPGGLMAGTAEEEVPDGKVLPDEIAIAALKPLP